MPHLHRFFASPEDDDPHRAVLRDEEAHHAIHVVRLKAGDRVEVLDGRGRRWPGTIAALTRRDVTIQLAQESRIPHPATALTLLQGWLHREKSIEEIIRRCTEIGVGRFVFFRAERSERAPKVSSKWERLAVESCKQCGRAWLPEFEAAESLEAALGFAEGTLLVATKEAAPQPLARCVGAPHATLAVGPEGDFTDRELHQILGAGAHAISLGEAVLRSEAAAVVGSCLVQYELGQLGPRSREMDPG
jgi:16S rRNA (uracil1498-N3)-methyltransferase